MKNKSDRKFIAYRENSRFIDAARNVSSPVQDKFRSRVGDLWLFFDYNSSDESIKIKNSQNPNLPDSIKPSIIDYTISPTDVEMVHRVAFETRDNSSLFEESSQREFEAEMRSLEGREFYDICYMANLLEDESNLSEQESGILNLYASSESNYNFLQSDYEGLISNPENGITELDLPNFYSFTLFDQTTFETRRALTLDGRIRYNPDARLENGATPRTGNVSPTRKYYSEWSNNWADFEDDSQRVRREMNDVMERISFSQEDSTTLSEVYEAKDLFPMYNSIQFTTEADSEFGDTLEDTNFSTKLQNFLIRTPPTDDIYTYSIEVDDKLDGTSTRSYTKSEKSFIWLYSDFVEMMQNDDSPAVDSVYGFSSGGEETRAYRTIMSLIVQGKVNRLKKKYRRDYKQISDGEIAHSEPFSYLVTKSLHGGARPIQYFHFANTKKSDVIKFVDSQVNYGRKYTYEIYSNNIVFATKYVYSDFNIDVLQRRLENVMDDGFGGEYTEITPPKKRYTFSVTAEPETFITRTLIYSKNLYMVDKPPLPPEPIFVPYRGVSDKISIYLNSSVGEIKEEPIIMSETDAEQIEIFRENQNIPPEETKISFGSDDIPYQFILYRIDYHPSSYKDFQSGKIVNITTGNDNINATLEEKQRSTSASYCDKISANKKYYYCFREEDVHGHLSNPSPIYCVEIYDDNGSIYPVIDVVDLKEPDNRIKSIGVKRFICIKPSYHNLFVNESDSGFDEDEGPSLGGVVKLGISEDRVWGKKFKIRLTSRSTGRKVDFNFSLTQRTRNIPRDET